MAYFVMIERTTEESDVMSLRQFHEAGFADERVADLTKEGLE